jgi:uncharacterized membrane protein YGL010W
MNPKLIALFEEYADDHRHPINQLTHKIAIPLIVFHLVAMLNWVKLTTLPGGSELTLGHLAYLAAIVWYFSLSLRLGWVMAILFGLCFPLARMTPWPAVLAAAVVGWTVQLAGHAIWERNRPAFTRNMIQALVGPLFFVAKLAGQWPRAAGSGLGVEEVRHG